MSAVAGQLADAAAIRALAAEILQRPEYVTARDPEDLLKYLRWLVELLDWLRELSLKQPGLYWLITGGLLLLLALLVAHICWAISRALRTGSPVQPPGAPAPPADFSRDAEQLAAEGRHLEAAHRLLLATLQHLGRRGLIELRPEDANRTLRARVEGSRLPGALRRELTALMLDTERLWFRDRPNDRGLYDRWALVWAELLEATR